MKGTGIIRRIDDLGRVVIPKGVRRTYGFIEGDPLEVCYLDEGVLLRKYQDKTNPKVIIHVRGGIAEVVECSKDINVEIIDFDNIEDDLD